MRIIFNLSKIKKYNKPVVALGVFDGVHRAHRRILRAVVKQSKAIKGTSIVVTFWPHPQKENSLYSLEHRLRLIEELGIDVCIVIRFNKAFSRLPAEDFIKDILIDKIHAIYIYVGKNFRFGNRAKGNFRTLNKLSNIYNFTLKVFKVIKINHRPISSTSIRRLITMGNLKTAQRLLSRPVSVLGTVIKGSSLATKLGFPTANIDPHHEVIPPQGVYAVRIIFNKKKFNGICNIGTKPTFLSQTTHAMAWVRRVKSQKSKAYIEVHMFNFDKNIYGKYLEIQFIKKIRDEKKFASPYALVEQIKKDTIIVQRMFSLP